MHSRQTFVIPFLLLSSALLGAGTAGCDQLALPTQPATQQGDTDGGDGGTTEAGVSNGMIPPGAIVAEGTFAGESGFMSWATLEGGVLKEFGFSIPLPVIQKAGTNQVEGYLPLPQPVLDQTVFKTFSLIYLPHGHIPAGVYDVPHWEWHLLTVDKAAVEAVDCTDGRIPTPAQLPPDYFSLPSCLVHLGMHAFSLKAPEFTGGRFEKGIYAGYYHGEFFAVEPKVATSALLQREEAIMPGYDPTPLGPKGRYPKSFHMKYSDAGNSMVLTVTDWFEKN